MKFGILVTNNGTHSAEKWASAVSDKIVEIAQVLEGEKLIAAQKLQLAVSEALLQHHTDAQDEILNKLATGTHFDSEISHDPGDRLNQALIDIQTAAKDTPWENHFHNKESVEKIKFIIGQSLVDLQHVERLNHADKNPNDAGAAKYKAYYNGGSN